MHRSILLLLSIVLAPTAHAANDAQLQRGQYLVDMLACAACHTDGQLIDEPNADRYLAGSSVGIAYTNDAEPGVVFPANLTPDKATGLGHWKPAEIRRNVQYGIDKHGRQQLPIMPWPGYAHLTDEDADAIVAYLMSLPPVRHRVPKNVAPGKPSVAPYVRFGVYIFYPNEPKHTAHEE
jgi:mono/diheme cytochrome c family protein